MRTSVPVFVLMAVVALFAGVATAEEMPGDMVIDDCAVKKAPVPYPHTVHAERYDCVTCHHTSEELTAATCADIDVPKCSECHLSPEDPDVPDMTQMSLKKNPYHILCVDCHKAEDQGPTSCNDCHSG